MAAYNRGNRGGYGGGGGRDGSSAPGGNGDGSGGSRKLPDMKGRFDRYCAWCGEIIPDLALERLIRCPNNRCSRGIPISIPGRRRNDEIQRCSRCFCISHRSFRCCELCGRRRTEADVLSHQLNMDGVDPYMIDMPEAANVNAVVGQAPPAVAQPQPAVQLEGAAQAPPPAVVPVPPRPPTPVVDWANDQDDFDMGQL